VYGYDGKCSMSLEGDKTEVYGWIQRSLVRLRYLMLGKKDKGLVLRYIELLTGYSRQHVCKLVSQYRKTGYIRPKARRAKQGFATKYTREDIHTLAKLDQVVDDVSGTTVKAFCQREFKVFGNLGIRVRSCNQAFHSLV